jgi:multidrug efflux pump subunit AcrA (membrane-fusion protein)
MAFDAMTQVISQNAGLTPIVGDLLFKSADFPLADEIADRLRRMVPPQALGKGPDPQTQQLQMQLQQAQHAVVALQQQLEQAKAAVAKSQAQAATAQATAAQTKVAHIMSAGEQDREWYDSETKRLAAIGGIDPAALLPLIRQMVGQVMQENPLPHIRAHVLHDQSLEPQEPLSSQSTSSAVQ